MNQYLFYYIFFLFACVVTNLLVPAGKRWVLLVLFSCVFLAANSILSLMILFVLSILNFYLGFVLEENQRAEKNPGLIYPVVVLNLFPLILFKYFRYSFFSEGSDFLLPIGISFYTFGNLGYLMDVHRGAESAERHFGHFALYALFFPKLAAGPIERASNFLPRLKRGITMNSVRFREGVLLLCVGLLKKCVIAETLVQLVGPVFHSPGEYSASTLLVATIFARYYIFADFSGYTDIARGSAKVLGLELTENFRNPFWSESIMEFWQRWHISLSSWIRDYLYFPMIASPLSRLGNSPLILISFAFLGLWHGATLPFVLYGCTQGLAVVATQKSKSVREKLARQLGVGRFPRASSLLRIIVTFSLFVCLPTVLFMSESLRQAMLVYRHMAAGVFRFSALGGLYRPAEGFYSRAISFIFVAEVAAFLNVKFSLEPRLARCSLRLGTVAYVSLFIFLLALAKPGPAARFLYFQF